MGACKSRQTKTAAAASQKIEEPLFKPPPGLEKPTNFKLRPDAQPYVPVIPDEPEVKEPWEHFLDQKKKDINLMQRGLLRRARDGSYTADYKNLLVKPGWRGQNRSPSPDGRRWQNQKDFDLRGAWRSAQNRVASPPPKQAEAKVTPKKRKPTALKKAILANRETPETNALWEKFEDHLLKMSEKNVAEEKEETPAAAAKAKDDIVATTHRVPFGISDRCFVSDSETKFKAHRHCEESHAPIREYVNMNLTPKLEAAVTEMLFTLRRIRMQELGMGQKSRRYAIGFREVSRLVNQRAVQCLVVAPDVERTGGAIEDKIQDLVTKCKNDQVPVIYALSRRQLGQCIQKNVTVSVVAIQEVKGAMDQFVRMIDAATEALSIQ